MTERASLRSIGNGLKGRGFKAICAVFERLNGYCPIAGPTRPWSSLTGSENPTGMMEAMVVYGDEK
jgi:hypothetical protein